MQGKPYAGNPHVRFDEGAGAPRHSGRSALLYHNYKKILFGLALAMAGAGLAFDAEYTADQNVTISQGGAYLVTGTGGGSVTVSENVTGVELTIRDVTWTGNATKINLNAGSSVSLVIEGVSSQVCHFVFGECPSGPIVMRLFSSLPHNLGYTSQKTDIDDFSPVSSPFVYAWGVTFTPNALRIAPTSSPSASSIW